MSNMMKVGDTVLRSGAWGTQPPIPEVVTGIEINCVSKEGTPVDVVSWSKVCDQTVIVLFDRIHRWSYGQHVKPMVAT